MAKKGYFSAKNVAWRELPSGYTQVEYIESSGTQYIDTGFKPNQDTRVVAKAKYTSVSGSVCLFGTRYATNAERYEFFASSNSFRTSYNTIATAIGTANTNVIDIDKNKNVTSINGTIVSTYTYAAFQCANNLYLFADNQNGTVSMFSSAVVYSFQIYDNNTLVRDYVPCVNADGVAGLYDAVNGVFYGNAGTGSFSAGESLRENVAQEAKKVYFADINGIARKAKKAYFGDENGIARRWYASGIPINTLAVGSSVFMNVGGVRTEFLVIQQGTPDATLYAGNSNGTWLLMKESYVTREWDSSDNKYGQSDIAQYLDNEFYNMLDDQIKSIIDFVLIPVTTSSGTVASGMDGMPVKIFLLSYTEVGFSGGNSQGKGANIEGVPLSYFDGADDADRIAIFEYVATHWWLRSPFTTMNDVTWYVSEKGAQGGWPVTYRAGIRPALILPSSTLVDDNFNVLA